jgi:hypothetical protein
VFELIVVVVVVVVVFIIARFSAAPSIIIKQKGTNVRFQFFMAVNIQIKVFLVMMPCSIAVG